MKKRKKEELVQLTAKRRRLNDVATSLLAESETCAEEFKKKDDWALLSKSNALRAKAKDYQDKQLKTLESELSAL
jgi:hypothetical protein